LRSRASVAVAHWTVAKVDALHIDPWKHFQHLKKHLFGVSMVWIVMRIQRA
jgi:hypothetical protein